MAESPTNHSGSEPPQERRVDLDSRKRVVQIEQKVQDIARKMLWSTIWLAFAIVAMGFGFLYLLDRIQDSRVDSIEQGCIERNETRRNIQEFEISQNPKAITTVKTRFPVVANCHDYAEDLVR